MTFKLTTDFFEALSLAGAKILWLQSWGGGLKFRIVLKNGLHCTISSYDEIEAAVGRNRWEIFVIWDEDNVDSIAANLSEGNLIEWIKELSERK